MPSVRTSLRNIREGRLQRSLCAATAVSAVGIAFEIYVEHYRASFGNKWMWTPIAATPPLFAAGVAGVFSERAARTALPAASAVFAVDGLVGMYMHARGVARKPGGARVARYNVLMGPPLLAPGSLAMIGGIGLLGALMRREHSR